MSNPSSAQNSNTGNDQDISALLQALQETTLKVQSSLGGAIDAHVNSTDFTPKDGLDFLDTKNSLLLSYLIELTFYVRQRLTNNDNSSATNNLHRLTEMKTAMDKMRGLDKKLRYQIDKLLAAGTSSATTFAAGDDEDPLQFRPNAAALDAKEDDDSSSSSKGNGAGDSDEDNSSDSDGDQDDNHDEGEDDLDADLAAARLTLTMAKDKRKTNERETEDGVYRAPRLAAVPYTLDQADKQAEREKRQRRRMRASELAQTLRSQYGEAPETEDIHGGSELGKQREAARRMEERQAEKIRFEEASMVRLTTTRKEKKERKRLMRDESSNLAAISDLRNLVRESDFGDDERRERGRHEPSTSSERHDNGKRKRQHVDREGRSSQQGGRKNVQAKNSFQAALFGNEGGRSKKKRKGSRR